jgi:hypothetical protein
MKNSISLKWGALSAWSEITKPELLTALQKYSDLGMCMSVMAQKMTPEHKAALCEACDHADEIWLDWEGIKVDAESGKRHIMEYSRG